MRNSIAVKLEVHLMSNRHHQIFDVADANFSEDTHDHSDVIHLDFDKLEDG